LPYSPKNKVAVTATYRLPVPDSVGDVSLGSTYTYTGRQTVTPQDPFGELAGRSLVNLNLNWKSIGGKPVDAALFATNLFDRTYATYVTGGYTIFALEGRELGEPRMYGLRVRWHYGQ
jgi:iron complex outermembrane receptor protein